MTIELSEYVIDAIADAVVKKMYKPKTEWIPVTEKLPDIDEDVLATDGLDMFTAWWSDDGFEAGWHSLDDIYTPDKPILAWMPLPQPYKAESEG